MVFVHTQSCDDVRVRPDYDKSARREDTSACVRRRFARYDTISVSCIPVSAPHLPFPHVAHLHARVECCAVHVLAAGSRRAPAQGSEEAAAERRVRLGGAGLDVAHVRERAGEEALHLLERAAELRELAARRARGLREEVDWARRRSGAARRGSTDDARPDRSASVKRSSHGIGTKTQFSGFGSTPTGELYALSPAPVGARHRQ
jgi:hypothetical protein